MNSPARKLPVKSAVVTEGTKGIEGTHVDKFQDFVAITPPGRVGQPGDIGPEFLFLEPPDAGWSTGESLCAPGALR